MPSAPLCGMSTSAVKVYDESRMLGASPFGVPVTSPDQVNSVRPAARLGRGATTRVATVASSGRTWYLFASSQKRFPKSLTLSGYLSVGHVVVLRPILGDIIQFVGEAGRVLAHRRGEDPGGPHDLSAGDPAVVI